MIRYRSTYAAMAIALLVWLLANVPGQAVHRPGIDTGGPQGPQFDLVRYFEHGWPLVYLRRFGAWQSSPWQPWPDVEEFAWWPLLFNVLCGAVFIGAAALLFDRWRHNRPRLLQFTLRDLLIATVLVSLAGGYYVAHPAQRRKEIAALEKIDEASLDFVRVHNCYWESGGPTWLRDVLGDEPLAMLNHPVAIEIQGDKAIRVLDRFPTLREVIILGPVSNEGRAALSRLPHLVAIDVPVAGFWEMDEPTPLVHLRGLKLRDATVSAISLRNLPALEVLDLSHAKISGDWATEVSQLPQLVCLHVAGTPLTSSDVRQLAKCPELRELWLDAAQLTPELIAELSQLTQVKDLAIVGELSDAELASAQADLPSVRLKKWP